MVLAAVPFPGIAPGALLTDLPAQAASNEITKTVAIAEKMKLVADSAKVRAGRAKLFMVTTSPWVLKSNNQWMNAGEGQTCRTGAICLEAGGLALFDCLEF